MTTAVWSPLDLLTRNQILATWHLTPDEFTKVLFLLETKKGALPSGDAIYFADDVAASVAEVRR